MHGRHPSRAPAKLLSRGGFRKADRPGWTRPGADARATYQPAVGRLHDDGHTSDTAGRRRFWEGICPHLSKRQAMRDRQELLVVFEMRQFVVICDRSRAGIAIYF
jgi:hypothetical protein